MSASALTDPAVPSAVPAARDDQHIRDASATPTIPLFIVPSRSGNGFRASIRGHSLDLADPDSAHGLAPTPSDLLAAAVASDVAWFARRYLRDHELDAYVSVSAWAPTNVAAPTWSDFDLHVEISAHAAAIGTPLAAALERRFEGRSGVPRIRVGPPFTS